MPNAQPTKGTEPLSIIGLNGEKNWPHHFFDNFAFFVPTSTTWLSKLTTAGKGNERLRDFWRGCVNLQTPGSHQSSLNKRNTTSTTLRRVKTTSTASRLNNYQRRLPSIRIISKDIELIIKRVFQKVSFLWCH